MDKYGTSIGNGQNIDYQGTLSQTEGEYFVW